MPERIQKGNKAWCDRMLQRRMSLQVWTRLGEEVYEVGRREYFRRRRGREEQGKYGQETGAQLQCGWVWPPTLSHVSPSCPVFLHTVQWHQCTPAFKPPTEKSKSNMMGMYPRNALIYSTPHDCHQPKSSGSIFLEAH